VEKEELGGASVHCRISGVADNAVRSEEEAVSTAKRFLSYLPANAWCWPPHLPTDDDPTRADEEMLTIVPDDLRKPYDMKRVIRSVSDHESFFEIAPEFARMIITGFARIAGHPVGIVANQPVVQAGAITAAAARKARHFVDVCAAYHVPLVFLQDVPGVMPGLQSEREGVLRAGLSLAYSLAWSDVARITVVLRKAFGFGACAMGGGGNSGQTLMVAWPGAVFGSLPARSSVLAAHASELERSSDPAALERELMANYERCSGAFHAANKGNIDDVIDPRETRARIAKALELDRSRRSQAPAPLYRRGVMP
jgi:acetyl-CoA/propionyl-CoA carboxylase carboxyl transferase subunit